ncbi:hypothetical protein Taro_021540 [Colocasia esculenta]|uniref:Uncharacterized protein n=1 Tax=Colocasia esculenta TaxID=4460 RepID=A0A843V5A8_COLES|nr:hypothetical protein [Colocasia esculenta]
MRDSGAESFVELSCLGLGRRGVRSAFLAQNRQSFVSLLLSALVPEPRSGARREAVAWPGCGVACVVCFCGGSISHFAGVEAEARLTRACGCSRFGVLSVSWSHSRVPARDGTGVCSFPTWQCVRGLGCAEHCFRFMPDSICFIGSRTGNPYWALFARLTPPPYFLQLGAHCRGSSMSDGLRMRVWCRVVVSSSESECCELLYLSERRVVFCKSSGSVGGGATLGFPGKGSERSGRYNCCCCAACVASVVARCVHAVEAQSELDSLAVVFLVWRTLAIQSRCLCLVGYPFVVGVCVVVVVCLALCAYALCSGRRAEQAELHRLVALCSGGGFPELFVVVLSSALVVLVEVLPGLAFVASAVLLAAMFSLMVCVLWSWGLCILVKCAIWLGRVLVRYSQDGSWRFLVEVLPKAPSCCFGCRVVPLAVRLAAALASLSYGGLLFLAACLRNLGHWVLVGLVRGLGPARPVVPFQACGSLPMAFVWKPVAESPVGSSGDNVFRASVAVCHVVEHVTPSFCGSACIWCPCPTTRKVWVRPSGDSGYRFHMLRVLRVCFLSLLDCEEELVADWLVLTARSAGGYSNVVFGWRSLLFRLVLASLDTCGVVVPSVTRWGGPSRSGCRVHKAQAGYPFPLSLLLPFSLSIRRPLPPLFSPLCVSGEEEGRAWCPGVVEHAWSEEEPGMEHPLVCLLTDVAAAVRVATSVEASPQEDVVTRCPIASRLLSRRPCHRDGLWGRDSACAASVVSVAGLCVGVCPRASFALRTF